MQAPAATTRHEREPARIVAALDRYGTDRRGHVVVQELDDALGRKKKYKDVDEMLEFLNEQKLKVLPTKVCERVAFRRAIGEGATVQEIGRDQAAVAEVEGFFREITA